MALRGRREPPSQSDGLGGPSYRFPQIVTALSIVGMAKHVGASTHPTSATQKMPVLFLREVLPRMIDRITKSGYPDHHRLLPITGKW